MLNLTYKYITVLLFVTLASIGKVKCQNKIEVGTGIAMNFVKMENDQNSPLKNHKLFNQISNTLSLKYSRFFNTYFSSINVFYENKNYKLINKDFPAIDSKFKNRYIDLNLSIGKVVPLGNTLFSISSGLSYSRWLNTIVHINIPEITSVISVNNEEQFNLLKTKYTYQFKEYDKRNLYGYNIAVQLYLNDHASMEIFYLNPINSFKITSTSLRNKTIKFTLYYNLSRNQSIN